METRRHLPMSRFIGTIRGNFKVLSIRRSKDVDPNGNDYIVLLECTTCGTQQEKLANRLNSKDPLSRKSCIECKKIRTPKKGYIPRGMGKQEEVCGRKMHGAEAAAICGLSRQMISLLRCRDKFTLLQILQRYPGGQEWLEKHSNGNGTST